MGAENEVCNIPDEGYNTFLCTAFPSFSRKGDIPLHTSKNRAKTTAQINVQEIIPINELQPSWRSHLEFYALRSRPPCLRQTTSYFKIG
jgi:hypothetical protein